MKFNSKLALYWLLYALSRPTLPSAACKRRCHSPRVPSERSRRQNLPGRRAPRSVQASRGPATPKIRVGVNKRIRDQSAESSPSLQIYCFGRFEVRRGGEPINEWRRDKARMLLKYLVDRRHPVHRDVLVELLWPESDTRAASNCLRVTLHALRQALGRSCDSTDAPVDYVTFDGTNISLNHAAADLWIDVEAFSENFEAGLRLERQHHLSEAFRCYEAAELLYRDDYLVEDLYEDWTLLRREELKDQYLMVVTRLADACLQRGDPTGCIVRCHRILEKDPCREDAYCRLMRCYAQLGQISQAVHWYDLCVQTLRKELDLAPGEQTVRIREKITAGRQ
ncbi:MAG TPA: BTAD domain-containing putative transcriptional regulator [Chloroflexota bacterium]|nr:BTAD domain-containing putative transcriptional regulator [Chloroflexota bacterium]